MKRLFCILLVFIMTIGVSLNAFASGSYVVSADNITAKQGETITVPLRLSGNKGLMGFRISIKYPHNQLILTDVSSGSITQNGLFNTTITDYDSVQGKFDVVWSESREVKDDGTLFIMTYRVKDTADDNEYDISVAYSQEDTFNEDFKDARLICSPIKVFIGNVTPPIAKQEDETTKNSSETNSKDSISDDYLISSLNQVMESFGKNDIDSLTQKQQETSLKYVNNRIDSFGSGKKYDSFEGLKSDYIDAVKREATRKVLESIDSDKIISITNEALTQYGVKTFAELPKEKKKEAVEKMLQQIAVEGADESGFQNIKSYDVAAEVLDDIIKTEQNEKSIDFTHAMNNKKWFLAGGIAAVILTVTMVLLVVRKRRKQNGSTIE